MKNKVTKIRSIIAQILRRVIRRIKKHVSMHRPLFLVFPIRDQIVFVKRLSMVLRSGMPILQGLRILHEEVHSRSAERILGSLAEDVAQGQSLTIALKKFENIFGQFVINIVRVGEASGTLPENLEYISQELHKKHELRKKIITALMYPFVIVCATLGITVLLIVYIFPKILPVFLSLTATLPLSTQLLILLSTLLTQYGLLFLLVFLTLGIVYVLFLRADRFHLFIDRILVRLPLFGKLSQYYNLANMCRTMSLLLKSDVRIADAIEITADSLRNRAYQVELHKAGAAILHGQRISTRLKHNKVLFPTLLVQMVSVGESTGNLSETFKYLSRTYESEIRDWTKNLSSVLEPILMLTMGLIVGFIAISVIAPIYGITQNLHP